jgi:hypothetical protein
MTPTVHPVLEVEIRNQFGNTVYHPYNAQAKHLAMVAGHKTLTLATLERALRMGFEIQYRYPVHRAPVQTEFHRETA